MIAWRDAPACGWHSVDGRDVFGPLPLAPKSEPSQEVRAAEALLQQAKRREWRNGGSKERWAPIDPWRER